MGQRAAVNVNNAYHDLQQAVTSLGYATEAVGKAIALVRGRSGGSYLGDPAVPYGNAASNSSLAAEFACEAALAFRGVEPRRSHSVDELCSAFARRDPLLAVLKPLDGRTRKPT